MSLFGVELPGHASSAVVSGEVVLTKGQEVPVVPCHCDEESTVVAELVEIESGKCGAEDSAEQGHLAFEGYGNFGVALMGRGEVLRPPPPWFEVGLYPERSVYSVYRL